MISAAMSRSRIGHPRPADAAPDEVLGGERQHGDEAERHQVARGGAELGPVTSTPSTARFGAVIVPDDA